MVTNADQTQLTRDFEVKCPWCSQTNDWTDDSHALIPGCVVACDSCGQEILIADVGRDTWLWTKKNESPSK